VAKPPSAATSVPNSPRTGWNGMPRDAACIPARMVAQECSRTFNVPRSTALRNCRLWPKRDSNVVIPIAASPRHPAAVSRGTRYATARTSKPLLHPAAERGGVLGFDPDVLLRKRPQRVTVRLLLGEPRQRGGAVQLGRHQRQVRALEGGAAEGPELLH